MRAASTTPPSSLSPLLGPVTVMWFYLPDARTVVLESEENVKKLIDAKAKPLPAPAWADDWRPVEGGTFALALTDVKGKLAKRMADGETGADPVQQAASRRCAICIKATRATVGIDLGDGCSVTVRLACATAADASEVDDGCQARSSWPRRPSAAIKMSQGTRLAKPAGN